MHQEIIFCDAILADGNNFRMGAIHTNTAVSILAEDHWLTVLKIKHAIHSYTSLGKGIEGVIVKDVAVLIDLNKRNSLVFGCCFDYASQMFDINIDRARHEG